MRTLETGTDDLLARADDGVAVLTLNRPARPDALSRAMLEALAGTPVADDDVACLVPTGAGGAFCADGDVGDGAGHDDAPAFDARVQRRRRSIERREPVVRGR